MTSTAAPEPPDSPEEYERKLQELLSQTGSWISQGAAGTGVDIIFDRLNKYDEALPSALDKPAVEDASDKEVAHDLKNAEIDQAYQANTLRKSFFKFVVVAVAGVLIASAALMGMYVWSEWSELDPGVMIAWYSATVVQVIGLAYIVARYLFAPRGQINNGSAGLPQAAS